MRNSILTIVAGLLVATAVHVAGTAAAASKSGASKSATKIAVRIHLKGGRFTLSGVTYTRAGGTFTRSGAISDRGAFVDRCHRGCFQGPGNLYVRTLRGVKGTIWVIGARKGHWRISKGTRAYAGLRGRGRERGLYSRERGLYSRAIDVTMIGTLSR
jgi:hypothetical protein